MQEESKTEKQVLVPTCTMYIQICLIILTIVKRNHQNVNGLKCHLLFLKSHISPSSFVVALAHPDEPPGDRVTVKTQHV